ncbi:FAD dependent oxidoreductase [Corynespora cassiicola Philippines]|uniref:FAD dependent oxidoreductase n=1 Tax=Corynespora cassiicola Philippines TaxID=1448308 RepID=A0A2T2NFC1_CORCC|nr:FAD dependent oxidoreductase [Corynespora cassiicola Philippines]
MAPAKDTPINIVGAGVFGLSTALHLGKRGYRNVAVFDKQPYDETLYSYMKGCDGASADINKIIRSAYGSQVEYQEMGLEAIDQWKAWNEEISKADDLLFDLQKTDCLFHNSGNLTIVDGDTLPPFELATIKAMEENGHKDTQLVTADPRHVAIAETKGLGFAMDPFGRRKTGKHFLGVLDSSGGHAVADKACRFALHKARQYGATFVLDSTAGAFVSFTTSSSGQVTGIKTKDGKTHEAELTIMACGGWTPSLLPQLDGLCETTGGSVIIYKIPRSSPLWDKLSPERFPSWSWKIRDGAEGGLYGFPRDERGNLKIGYRGTKYTNPQIQPDGKERSVPITRWSGSETGFELKAIPAQATTTVQKFVHEYLPEMVAEGIEVALTRMCWYTDSFDNHYVVDHAPGHKGLFVATGGSGHAFKYLPNLGKWVVDIIEQVNVDRPAIKAWKWRSLADGKPINVLMEGSQGDRALNNVALSDLRGIGEHESVKL